MIRLFVLIACCTCLLSACAARTATISCDDLEKRYEAQKEESVGWRKEDWFHKGKYAAYSQLWEEFCR